MKIIFNNSPQEITHYEIANRLSLIVKQDDQNDFIAFFDEVRFKNGINDDRYFDVIGVGDSVDSALCKLCEELSGKCVVYYALSVAEEVYKIPPLKHTLKVFG